MSESSGIPLRIATLTSGMINGVISQAIIDSKSATLVAVASRELSKAQAFIDKLKRVDTSTVSAYGSYDDVINNPDIDAVYVPVPTQFREAISIRVCQAGKHLLCDKPYMDQSSLNRIIDAAETAGVAFMDATHFVHHPRTHAVKEALSNGVIGDLLSLNVTFQFPNCTAESLSSDIRFKQELEPRGSVADMGWYCARAAVEYLLGDEGAGIVVGGHAANIKDDTTGAVARNAGHIQFDDGKSFLFQSGYQCGYASQLLVISGTKGTLKITDFVLDWASSFAYADSSDNTYVPKYRIKRAAEVFKTESVEVSDGGIAAHVRMIDDFAALCNGDGAENKRLRIYYRRQALRTTALVDRMWDDAQPSVSEAQVNINYLD